MINYSQSKHTQSVSVRTDETVVLHLVVDVYAIMLPSSEFSANH